MSVDLSQFHQVFIDEAYEHLSTMESLLLAVDLANPSLDDLNAIFRAAHSIKGGAGTFGFTDIAQLTHALETLLDLLRKEELSPTYAMIDAFLRCCDVLGNMLDVHQHGGEVDPTLIADLRTELLQLAETDDAVNVSTFSSGNNDLTANQLGWVIHLHPRDDVFAKGASWEAINTDLKALGTLEVLQPATDGQASWRLMSDVELPELQEIFAYVCAVDEVTFTAENALESDEGFGFFVDESELAAGRDEIEGFGFFVDESELAAGKEDKESTDGFGFFVDEQSLPIVAEVEVKSINKPIATAPTAKAVRPATAAEASIRVGVEKVDQLINLVGELVITRSMLAQSLSTLDPMEHEEIYSGLSSLERNSRDLQEAVMSIRMMPINFVFGRFPRVVRDLSAAMNKKVALKLLGEDTELDKGLIEKLADPLTHLVRNSIDHGIETPEERLAAGKSEQGTITLSAGHQGGSILVEVVDDGAGLNRERLIAGALKKGILLSENPSDKEVWQLIFAAGFSTAAKVTDVSGRGVGMDVVMRNITEMKGQIDVDSESGKGTRISLRLPLTLAILDGMSLRVGDEVFILPLTRIIESMQPDPAQLKTLSGKGRVVHIRGEYLPLLPLYKIFNLEPRFKKPEEGILVVVESAEGKLALFVDELISQNQVVIKSLETHYRRVEGVSGATIMGDGRVALIIDIEQLAKMTQLSAANS
ncbi:MAG TPA: chemotaxis protein CheW [Marinospirillum sp.]|uniref:chemotaxis protein CheW n=1 Tax=Marinospirillum sp. TaxID=2183934 RepID=UPI002B493657|nr:chemotaxis protein CheW [Marinospirillum sp.]HKM14430.1 chemotaxis protein CheW [Marinospirillum sp.]